MFKKVIASPPHRFISTTGGLTHQGPNCFGHRVPLDLSEDQWLHTENPSKCPLRVPVIIIIKEYTLLCYQRCDGTPGHKSIEIPHRKTEENLQRGDIWRPSLQVSFNLSTSFSSISTSLPSRYREMALIMRRNISRDKEELILKADVISI